MPNKTKKKKKKKKPFTPKYQRPDPGWRKVLDHAEFDSASHFRACPKADCPPLHVAVPNTTTEKLRTISLLAQANLELAKALNPSGPDVQVTISGCTISNSQGAGITIYPQPEPTSAFTGCTG